MMQIGRNIQNLIRAPLGWEEPESDRPAPPSWGWLSVISVLMAGGVLLLSVAGVLSRLGSPWGVPLFWMALVLIYSPSAARFISRDISRAEGVGLIIVLSVGTYLVNYLKSPILFRGFDEFLHWRTVYDILQTRALFTPNSMLPISPFYPGLEIVTSALVNLTGVDIMAAAAIVLVTARLIMLLGLFLLFEGITRSVRAAGIGVLVYMGSSTFLQFDVQYGYESLALPLSIMAVLMMYRRGVHEKHWRPGWTILIIITAFGVVVTHHATAYMLIGFTVIWACIDIFTHLRNGKTGNPLDLAFCALVLAAAWVSTVAKLTVGYLTPFINDSLNSIYEVLLGKAQARQLFVDAAGRSAMSVDKVFAIASVLILLAGLAVGFWYWWLHHTRNSLAVAMVLGALIYPALPLMRLSGGSWEMANRLSGFVFAGLGFVVALAFVKFPLPMRWLRARQWAVVAATTLAFLGGVVAGVSPDSRLPQPYRAAAGERSIDNEGVMAAEWARTVLGPNNRMASDRTMTTLLGSYGDQRMVVDLSDHVSISGIFVGYDLTPSNRDVIADARIRYLAVDTRITKELSTLGYYFESWEQTMFLFAPPPNVFALEKFDYIPGISRIYDSGDIHIYDVGGAADAH